MYCVRIWTDNNGILKSEFICTCRPFGNNLKFNEEVFEFNPRLEKRQINQNFLCLI